MSDTQVIEDKYRALVGRLDEATLRLWAAVEARSLARGGVSKVAKATGLSRTTIYAGLKELESTMRPLASSLPVAVGNTGKPRIRAKGGGRKRLTDKDATLLHDLDALVEPTSRGDPQSPLRWTCKSTVRLAKELADQGHDVSQRSVYDLLTQLHYSLQSTRKTREGGEHPDRDAQFHHIARMVTQYHASGDPVISVDTKKKELVGDFKNSGREWQPKGVPEQVRIYDFIDRKPGKVAPYGVCDVVANQGWVSVGINHDTAEFAVESIRRWWKGRGAPFIRARVACWSPRTAVAATDIGFACGLCNYRNWRMNYALASRFVTFPREQASGTKSSIGCSATSPITGAVVLCSALK